MLATNSLSFFTIFHLAVGTNIFKIGDTSGNGLHYSKVRMARIFVDFVSAYYAMLIRCPLFRHADLIGIGFGER